MKTYNTIFKIFFTLTFLIFCTSCEIDSFAESDEHSFGEIIAPTNIQISANIIGQDADNPNGDGSGKVEFTVTADNAITYKFINNGAESLNPSGKVSYTFTALGVNSYTITAVAVGSGGTTSSQNISVDVLLTYIPPAELITALTTGTWRMKKDEAGHLGVAAGLNADNSANAANWGAPKTWWWTADPLAKEKTGIYDDTYTFSNWDPKTGKGKMSFNVGPDKSIFGKEDPMKADLGGDRGATSTGDPNYEYEYYPYENFEVDFTIVPFTARWDWNQDGKYEDTSDGQEIYPGEKIILSGTGFIGFYVGNQEFFIWERSENRMKYSTIGRFDGNSWHGIITNDN
tara:strand:+ start:72 stop:1103 length:1032 start_codon:yes stop_codon:yes gene_type:complete